MKAIHLQTEYLTEPLGLGIAKPRFYWNCEGGIKQTAYQIIAQRDGDVVWNSGKVSAPFQNVDFRRNGMSFFAGQHTGVIQPYTPHHLLA